MKMYEYAVEYRDDNPAVDINIHEAGGVVSGKSLKKALKTLEEYYGELVSVTLNETIEGEPFEFS